MRTLILAASLVLAMATVAPAANIFVNDLAEGFATVSGVPNCNGTTITIDCVTNKSNFSNEGLFFTFVSSIPTAAGQGGNFFSTLTEGPWPEPGDPTQPGQPSDWLTFNLTVGSQNINVRLCSDPDTTSLVCATTGFTSLGTQVENGGFQLMAQYVFVGTGGEIDNFFLASDVPEPGSMMLIGAGLLGVGLVGRRRKTA